MGKKILLLVLIALSSVLVSCGSDGTATMHIPYQTELGVEYIKIVDDDSSNGVHVDKDNNRLYCQEGKDTIVKLPAETKRGEKYNRFIELKAESVCFMGQQDFDAFMALFKLVEEP